MTSKKLQDNIETGLWARFPGSDYCEVMVYETEDEFVLSFRLAPPDGYGLTFAQGTFTDLDELEARMREVQPDLRRWHINKETKC